MPSHQELIDIVLTLAIVFNTIAIFLLAIRISGNGKK